MDTTRVLDEIAVSAVVERMAEAEEGVCPHVIFPEVSESEVATFAVDFIVQNVAEYALDNGADALPQDVAEGILSVIGHSMIVLFAAGMALGASRAVRDVEDFAQEVSGWE